MGKYDGKTAEEWEAIADEAKRNRNKYEDNSVDWDLYNNEYIQARNKANIARDHSSNSSTSSSATSSSSTTSSSSSTSSNNTTPSVSTTSTSSTTPSVSTTSSLSSNTTSSNDVNAVAGTSTTISTPADYSSSDTGNSEDVSSVSSNTDTTTDVSGGEDSIDYSSEGETAVEPSIETPDESTYQAPEIFEETPATPEQPSGQYIYAPVEGAELWGSLENDTLVGGDGDDIFYGGKDQGSDTFLNVSSTDKVYLSDVTFNDLSDVKKEGDMITFTFKNGNTVNIQSSDTISGAVVLADSTWHFQHTPQA